METIQANVNPRLLSKADRLFTGSVEGRIIEILQNARRAGATEVKITNRNGFVTVRDSGEGIQDFTRLLDLGGSGWDDTLENSEDPAGVGLFCLAPRATTISSHGKTLTIKGDAWSGEPVPIRKSKKHIDGTELRFIDEAWEKDLVEEQAVFSGLKVTVSGKKCAREKFVTENAASYPELGCKIEVRNGLTSFHQQVKRGDYCDNVLVNFHGQVISFRYDPIGEDRLKFLVDLSGDPTGIRLMLPARTRLVENEALVKLKQAIEIEAYRYIQRRGNHTLPYNDYLRAKELSIDLLEAEPTFEEGLLFDCSCEVHPVQVSKPKELPLSKCYRLCSELEEKSESAKSNAHLLAALGKFDEPFVPVAIDKKYDGYLWAELPTITKIAVSLGKEFQSMNIWDGTLTCADKLTISATSSDGRTLSSDVCMAIAPNIEENDIWPPYASVTPDAKKKLSICEIWYHLGGFTDDGDRWDTQYDQVEEELERFWDTLVGPDEKVRREVCNALKYLSVKWKSVTVFPDGRVNIHLTDGGKKSLNISQSIF